MSSARAWIHLAVASFPVLSRLEDDRVHGGHGRVIGQRAWIHLAVASLPVLCPLQDDLVSGGNGGDAGGRGMAERLQGAAKDSAQESGSERDAGNGAGGKQDCRLGRGLSDLRHR